MPQPKPNAGQFTIRQVEALTPGELTSLSSLLVDAVNGGASVGFLRPLQPSVAQSYWEGLGRALATGELSLWVAEAATDGEVIGTVQIELCSKENGQHSARLPRCTP